MKNEYLEQVTEQQQRTEEDLKAMRMPAATAISPAFAHMPEGAPSGGPSMSRSVKGRASAMPGSVAMTAADTSQAVGVRITGWWQWKTVIVPPNAYVVHTRRGEKAPLHLGLGISFRFNPYTDSFLVVPSTMQTILIQAKCICRDLQGLVVQGYVQWIIGDFATAFKKLDFSDVVDPMRVVNVQLREQAEAAIKDKVATMGMDEVLSDKQPIIQELTARLRQVAEGEGNDPDRGLGLRIVTVQVKEAVVSSVQLWEHLQKPFRTERSRVARLAELASESTVRSQELEEEKRRTTAQLESESELARLRAAKEAETFDREQAEKSRRHHREQDLQRQAALERQLTARQEQQGKRELEEAALAHSAALSLAKLNARQEEWLRETEMQQAQNLRQIEALDASATLERARMEGEQELAQFQLRAENDRKEEQARAENSRMEAKAQVENRLREAEVQLEAARQRIRNEVSPAHLQALLVETMPRIAEKLPKPDELRTIALGQGADSGAQALTSLVAQLFAVLEAFKSKDGQHKSEK